MATNYERLRAYLFGVLGVVLVLGLLVAGFFAALVLVPVGVVAFLVLRHRMRKHMTTMAGEATVWDSARTTRRADVIEGVAIDVTVEQPGGQSGPDPPGAN